MRRNGNLKLNLFFILAATSAIALLTFLYYGKGDGQTKDVLIPRGSSINEVAAILEHEGVIRYSKAFAFLLRATKGHARVRAGEFQFRYSMRIIDALRVLYDSEPIVHQITVPEGWTARQIARILSSHRLVDEIRFLKLALSKEGAMQFKTDGPTVEGFLFPDTYTFSRIDGEERIIERMVGRFFQKFGSEYKIEIVNSGFTLGQIVTLASIVEKETGSEGEREIISSVFHNRLRKRMRLQSDPTTIYGISNFDGNLKKTDLKAHSPYNTYTISGLPPGPIASPGLRSLVAALRPADTEFLYFVSNNKGGHIFTKTYAEHVRNVNTHQRVMSISKRPKK